MLKDDIRDPAMSKPYSPADQIGEERDYILARSCGRVHQGNTDQDHNSANNCRDNSDSS